jgi:hypothetical protein
VDICLKEGRITTAEEDLTGENPGLKAGLLFITPKKRNEINQIILPILF